MVTTTAKGNVRSFAVGNNDLEEIELRCNRRYDILLDLKHQHQQNLNILSKQSKKQQKIMNEQYKFAEKGIVGECILRSLSFFDVGI